MQFVYLPDKMEPVYRGKDIGIGTGRYQVRQEGSRFIVELPEVIGGIATEHHVKCHGWVPANDAPTIMIERTVRDARELEARKLSDEWLHNQEMLHGELRRLANEYGLIDIGLLPQFIHYGHPYVDREGNVVNARETFEKWREMEPQEFRRRPMQQQSLPSQQERPQPSQQERSQQSQQPQQERRGGGRPSE